MSFPESESGDTEPQKESNEQNNDDALVDKTLPNQDDTEPSLNLKRHRKPIVPISKSGTTKFIYAVAPSNRRKSASPTTQSMTDQEDLNNEDHHDYEQ